jgi:tRNA(Ile)-lysidine synthase TilS/MesJ
MKEGKMDQKTREKYDALLAYIKGLGSLAVAFSGGVDSTLLIYAAHEALGDKALAITAKSSTFPERERNEAADFCEQHGIRKTALFIIGEVVAGAAYGRSLLYDPAFTTGFRRGRKDGEKME